jgi:hypothetical protein
MTHPTDSEASDLRLSIQRALLGNVSANLAALHAHCEDRIVAISAYFFHEPSDEDKEYIEDAAGEAIGDFPGNYKIETRYGLLSDVVINQIKWNFLRAEAMSNTEGKTR